MNTEITTTVNNLLNEPKDIVIVGHKNPDGDALGSTLALRFFLLKKKHEAVVISPNDYPDFLNWLPGQDTVLKFNKDTKEVNIVIPALGPSFGVAPSGT